MRIHFVVEFAYIMQIFCGNLSVLILISVVCYLTERREHSPYNLELKCELVFLNIVIT